MPTLLVLLGPTAVGKTTLSLQLAERLSAPIVSADSRQMFRGMSIGTAAPTVEELECTPHYFIGTLAPDQYYSAACYEQEALRLINNLFEQHEIIILTGGSMLYLDAVCRGIDDIPTVDENVRKALRHRLETEGLDSLRTELQLIDAEYYARCDLQNARRIVHALEIYYTSGRPYSSFLTGKHSNRPFRIIKAGLRRERANLFDRINKRTSAMIRSGLIYETRSLSPYRYCNALNTVGYKESFLYIDGTWSLDQTLEKICRNTRVYAKKQMTWFQRDETIHWFDAESTTPSDILSLLR